MSVPTSGSTPSRFDCMSHYDQAAVAARGFGSPRRCARPGARRGLSSPSPLPAAIVSGRLLRIALGDFDGLRRVEQRACPKKQGPEARNDLVPFRRNESGEPIGGLPGD
jgi:hypothetical protein